MDECILPLVRPLDALASAPPQTTGTWQPSLAWRLEISRTIGGSTAAAVLGMGRFRKTPLALWLRMRAAIVENVPPPELPESDDLRRGRAREGDAIRYMAELLGQEIERHDQTRLVYDSAHPWAHALPDGWTRENQLVEVKCPRPGTIERCRQRGLLPEWWIQAQHNLHICRNAHSTWPAMCYVGLLDPIAELLTLFSVTHDAAFAAQLMEAERLFYRSVVENLPPLDAGQVQGVEVELDAPPLVLSDGNADRLALAFLRLKALLDDTEEALEAAKADLQTMIGEHVAAETASAYIAWKPHKPARTLDRAAVLQRYPQIETDAECWRFSKPARPFIVRPKQPVLDMYA